MTNGPTRKKTTEDSTRQGGSGRGLKSTKNLENELGMNRTKYVSAWWGHWSYESSKRRIRPAVPWRQQHQCTTRSFLSEILPRGPPFHGFWSQGRPIVLPYGSRRWAGLCDELSLLFLSDSCISPACTTQKLGLRSPLRARTTSRGCMPLPTLQESLESESKVCYCTITM